MRKLRAYSKENDKLLYRCFPSFFSSRNKVLITETISSSYPYDDLSTEHGSVSLNIELFYSYNSISYSYLGDLSMSTICLNTVSG